MEKDIKIIGKMDHTIDHTFESANRVYGTDGIAPTLPTSCGGGHTPKVMDINRLGVIEGDAFELNRRVYGTDGISPTITLCSGGAIPHKVLECCAMRGRGENNKQQLEVRSDGCTNSITTAQKDNMILEWIWEIDGELYQIRIRKLTPRECWRLMGFTDEDFDKAEKANSNTQLYKQAGNSIVVNVLEEIFKQML